MTRTVTQRTIAAALRRVKSLPALIEHQFVLDACLAARHHWRDGELNPLTTVTLFLIQVLHGNTAINHLRHLTSITFTASAYCQARKRLPTQLFEYLLRAITDTLFETTASIARWHGHRTFLIDGSTFTMPDIHELMKHFGHPSGQKPGLAFPAAHLMLLCDMTTGLIREVLSSPLFTSDLSAGVKCSSALRPGDLIIADRGFAGWAFFALYLQHDLHSLVRAHQCLMLSFNARKKAHPSRVWERLYMLDEDDQVIEWFKPKAKPRWMTDEQYDALPPSQIVRVIHYSLRRRGCRTKEVTLMTTLVDHELYPKDELIALYGRRWEIETNIRHLKETMKMNELHCKSVAGVQKELIMFALAYNMVRMQMFEASTEQKVDPIRISFIDALRAMQSRAGVPPDDPRARRRRVQLIVNPNRPGRHEPRAIKRRPPQRRLLMEPRAKARKRLYPQGVAR